MNLELLKRAKKYIGSMANGINPLNNEMLSDDDILNNVKISRCLFYVNNVLGEVLKNEEKKIKKNRKLPFDLSKESLNFFKYLDVPVPISIITNELNKLNTNPEVVKLKATQLTNWLLNIGILVEKEVNGRKYKLPTDIGKNMGLFIEERVGYNGVYYVVKYPKQVQEFIIDNFENLIEYINYN